MKPSQLLGQAHMPDGSDIRLTLRDDEYVILLDRQPLMTSRAHESEDALATTACQHIRRVRRPHVLVGGLGMGFTLRASLDALPAGATVTVAELVPEVVAWNRGPLAPLAGHPLDDPRVRIALGDVGRTLRANRDRFDGILLDVDNGPAALTGTANDGLYDDEGVATGFAALRAGGVLAVWSAAGDPTFERRLRQHGFITQVDRVRVRPNKGGARHTIFLGIKPRPSRPAHGRSSMRRTAARGSDRPPLESEARRQDLRRRQN